MAAEKVKKHPLTKTTPKQRQIINLHNQHPNASGREIARIANADPSYTIEILQRYGLIEKNTQEFKENRADIFAGVQDKLLASITEEDIKKTPLGSRILAACQIYDKERLERGQSTANIANNHSISESLQESIDKIIGRSVEAKQPVDNPVYNYDKSQVTDITQDNASD